ncbi:MAG: hypothetical protein OQK01_09620, partial [Xanthomonadales bacterium]|nr:hypothetical protein [Xanthomonadales bacterium]
MNPRTLMRKARAELDTVMAADAAWCRQRLAAIGRRLQKGQAVDRQLRELTARIEESRARVEQRAAGLPQPEFDAALPITAHREEILQAIARHQVIVVAGETG